MNTAWTKKVAHATKAETNSHRCRTLCGAWIGPTGFEDGDEAVNCVNCKRVMESQRKAKARGEMYAKMAQLANDAGLPGDWSLQLVQRPGASGYSWRCSCGQQYDGTGDLRQALGYLVGHATTTHEEVAL